MGRGRGSQQGISGLLGGSSQSTGPNQGIGAGARDPGTPEDVQFQKTQIHPNELDATGKIVGTLPFEGDAPTGEALLEIQKIVKASQARAEKVEREAIPFEQKRLVRRYLQSLHTPAGDGSPGGSAATGSSEDDAGAGDEK